MNKSLMESVSRYNLWIPICKPCLHIHRVTGHCKVGSGCVSLGMWAMGCGMGARCAGAPALTRAPYRDVGGKIAVRPGDRSAWRIIPSNPPSNPTSSRPTTTPQAPKPTQFSPPSQHPPITPPNPTQALPSPPHPTLLTHFSHHPLSQQYPLHPTHPAHPTPLPPQPTARVGWDRVMG
jgi:hypothetical protein